MIKGLFRVTMGICWIALLVLLSAIGMPACSNGDGHADGGGVKDADADSGGSGDDAGGGDDGGNGDTPRFWTAQSFVRVTERGGGNGEEYEGSVVVALYDGQPPVAHEEIRREGACRLLTWEVAFCEPPCEDGLCIQDECAPWPNLLSAGRVTIEGATQGVALEADANGFYSPVGGPLPANLFEAGAAIAAEAPGDAFPAFTLEAVGVAPLVHDFPNFGEIPDGEIEVTWERSGTPGVRVQAWFRTDYGHGTPPVVVECDSADDGSLVVPASLVEELRDPAKWSCGDCLPSVIRRYSRDVATVGAYEIELLVSHDTWVYLAPP